MTDLEAHVNAKGRKELVKQVREKIKELGIQYIYYQFVSVTGRIVGKIVRFTPKGRSVIPRVRSISLASASGVG